jgi:hypothetical protein
LLMLARKSRAYVMALLRLAAELSSMEYAPQF